MSIRWMTRVFASGRPVQATERLMLLALADNANDEGVCWPSMNTLRSKCGLATVRGAEKVVARLERSGFLRRVLRDGKTTVYHLRGEAFFDQEDGGKPVDKTQTPERTDGGTTKRSPNARTGVKRKTPERGDGTPPSSGTGEPSKNHHKEKQQQSKTSARVRGAASGVSALDGCGAATAASLSAKTLDGLLPAAAAFLEEKTVLLRALCERGVDEQVAEELVEGYDAGRIRAMIERGDKEAETPGFYVAAIRNGYSLSKESLPPKRLKPRFTWYQVCKKLEAEGLNPAEVWDTHYEMVAAGDEDEPRFLAKELAV